MSTPPSTTAQPTNPTSEVTAPASEQSNLPTAPSTEIAKGPLASLYVTELAEFVNESVLFEFFSMVGPVVSIRVCRDSITGRSLGYAYVNYANAADAERAIETLNYSEIQGKQCRIMWSQRDPNLRIKGTGNIFIRNLEASIDNKALHDTFSTYGNILSVKVVTENGKSKGFGFVHFEKLEDAENAIKSVNGMLLNDLPVHVGHHESLKTRAPKAKENAETHFTNVYVKNLDPSVTEDDLCTLFSKFGNITSNIIQKGNDGKSKEFGFINFENHDDAVKAIAELHETELKGKNIHVCRAMSKKERELELRQQHSGSIKVPTKNEAHNLYVKNIPVEISDDELKTIFEPFGSITSCAIMRHEDGTSKGFGFVCYTTADESAKALSELSGKMINNKPLYISYAQKKEERRNLLMAQRNSRQPLVTGPGGPMFPGMYYSQGPGGFSAPPRAGMYPQPGMPGRMSFNNGARGYQPHLQGSPARGFGGKDTGRRFPNDRADSHKFDGKPQAMPEPQPSRESFSAHGITLAALAAASPEEQKQLLGEQLFPLIAAHDEALAGKITGMLLEMENEELLHLLDSPPALKFKVQEAIAVLHQHGL